MRGYLQANTPSPIYSKRLMSTNALNNLIFKALHPQHLHFSNKETTS